MYRYAYTGDMDFEWDPQKAASNLRKHGIRFADAVAVFEDRLALTIPEKAYEEAICYGWN